MSNFKVTKMNVALWFTAFFIFLGFLFLSMLKMAFSELSFFELNNIWFYLWLTSLFGAQIALYIAMKRYHQLKGANEMRAVLVEVPKSGVRMQLLTPIVYLFVFIIAWLVARLGIL